MSRFHTFEAGKIGHAADDVAIGFGEAVAPGVIDASSVRRTVGVAVGRGVACGVTVGPAVGVVGVAVAEEAVVGEAVAETVGPAGAAESKPADRNPAEPVGTFGELSPTRRSVGEGLAVAALLPDGGTNRAKATASTTIPRKTAATAGRVAVRMRRS